MLQRKIFTKTNSYIGFVGNIFMLVYIVMVTFYPAAEKVALLIAMPGGLLVMTWVLLFNSIIETRSRNHYTQIVHLLRDLH